TVLLRAFFFSSRRRHTRFSRDWSSDVCSSDLNLYVGRTSSDEYLLLHISSLTTSEVRYLRADDPAGEWRQVAPRVQDREYDVGHHGDSLYIRVHETGRKRRQLKAPAPEPAPRDRT